MGVCAYEKFLDAYKLDSSSAASVAAIKAINEYSCKYTDYRLRDPLFFDLAFHRAKLESFLRGPRVKTTSSRDMTGQAHFKETFAECAHCHDRLKVLKRCSNCGDVKYCSRQCQLKHWPDHRAACKKKGDTSSKKGEGKKKTKKKKDQVHPLGHNNK